MALDPDCSICNASCFSGAPLPLRVAAVHCDLRHAEPRRGREEIAPTGHSMLYHTRIKRRSNWHCISQASRKSLLEDEAQSGECAPLSRQRSVSAEQFQELDVDEILMTTPLLLACLVSVVQKVLANC